MKGVCVILMMLSVKLITRRSLVRVQFPLLTMTRLHRNVEPFFIDWVQHRYNNVKLSTLTFFPTSIDISCN